MSIRELIFEGKIPYYLQIKQGLFYLSFLTPLLLFFPDSFKEFGEFAWNILLFLMLIRPLSQVFPSIRLFAVLVPLRKELGLLFGYLVIAHGVGFVMKLGMIPNVFIPLSFGNHLIYAFLAGVLSFLLLITSNLWSQKLLKQNWKLLHKLIYPLFFLTIAHVYLVSGHPHYIVQGILVCIIWGLATMKKTIY